MPPYKKVVTQPLLDPFSDQDTGSDADSEHSLGESSTLDDGHAHQIAIFESATDSLKDPFADPPQETGKEPEKNMDDRQLSYDENLQVLRSIIEEFRNPSGADIVTDLTDTLKKIKKTTFPRAAKKALIGTKNMAINVLTGGSITSQLVTGAKNAAANTLKSENSYRKVHERLQARTQSQVRFLDPFNQLAIKKIDEEIAAEINQPASQSTLSYSYTPIEMMEKRQFILSVPNESTPFIPDADRRKTILQMVHEDYQSDLLTILDSVENCTKNESPRPQKVWYGNTGNGKTHLLKQLEKLYPEKTFYHLPPEKTSLPKLFAVPQDHSFSFDKSKTGYEKSCEEVFGNIAAAIVCKGADALVINEGKDLFDPTCSESLKDYFDPNTKRIKCRIGPVDFVVPFSIPVLVTANASIDMGEINTPPMISRFSPVHIQKMSEKQFESIYHDTLKKHCDGFNEHEKAFITSIIKKYGLDTYILETNRDCGIPSAHPLQHAVKNTASKIKHDYTIENQPERLGSTTIEDQYPDKREVLPKENPSFYKESSLLPGFNTALTATLSRGENDVYIVTQKDKTWEVNTFQKALYMECFECLDNTDMEKMKRQIAKIFFEKSSDIDPHRKDVKGKAIASTMKKVFDEHDISVGKQRVIDGFLHEWDFLSTALSADKTLGITSTRGVEKATTMILHYLINHFKDDISISFQFQEKDIYSDGEIPLLFKHTPHEVNITPQKDKALYTELQKEQKYKGFDFSSHATILARAGIYTVIQNNERPHYIDQDTPAYNICKQEFFCPQILKVTNPENEKLTVTAYDQHKKHLFTRKHFSENLTENEYCRQFCNTKVLEENQPVAKKVSQLLHVALLREARLHGKTFQHGRHPLLATLSAPGYHYKKHLGSIDRD